LKELEGKLSTEMVLLVEYNDSEELKLRDKQEKEMQEANIKQIKLDIIVNRHISELEKFKNDNIEKKMEVIDTYRDIYLKTIDKCFNDFIESVDPNLFIYNTENKLIQIKFKGTEDSTKVSDASVKSFFHEQKITFGLFNRYKLNVQFYNSKDHLNNDIGVTSVFKGDTTDDYTINEIYQHDSIYGESICALLNIFKYDNSEIRHLIDGLNSISETELIFDNFTKFFMKVEKSFVKDIKPHDNDIFITKHSNVSFDVIVNAYNKGDTYDEEQFNTGACFCIILSYEECVVLCK
jgi:hypothetical protein